MRRKKRKNTVLIVKKEIKEKSRDARMTQSCFDTHIKHHWQFVSSPDHGNFDSQQISMILPTNVHTMEVSKRLGVSWKFVGSHSDFHDLERTRFSQCMVIEARVLSQLFSNMPLFCIVLDDEI